MNEEYKYNGTKCIYHFIIAQKQINTSFSASVTGQQGQIFRRYSDDITRGLNQFTYIAEAMSRAQLMQCHCEFSYST